MTKNHLNPRKGGHFYFNKEGDFSISTRQVLVWQALSRCCAALETAYSAIELGRNRLTHTVLAASRNV
jgi:hypothetical protein